MSHDLTMFAILYGASMIPWLFALRFKARDTQWGLVWIDLALTVASYVFLFGAVGNWFWVIWIGMIGVGQLFKAADLHGYDNLTDKKK